MSGTFDKATPRPWMYTPTGPTMSDKYSQPFAIGEQGVPNLVAGCFGDVRGGSDAAEANARLIISAVNNRDDLIEMLDAITSYAESALAQFSNGRGTLDISGFYSLTKAARAALLSATREP